MKMYLIILIGLVALAGCAKDDPILLSPQDQEAVEGMDNWLNIAQAYNDSLRMCCEAQIQCNDSIHRQYDNHFHHADSMYLHHNNNFSHSSDHCDHNHDGTNSKYHHGNMHGSGGMNKHYQSGNGPFHKMEHHNTMQEMMENHCFEH